MKTLHSIRSDYSGTKAIFEVETDDTENVYMSVDRTNHVNEERGVIVLDAEKFLMLWRKEPYSIHSEISGGNPETWKKDRKFLAAEKGFSFGIDNPVPLAKVVCHQYLDSWPIYRRKYLVLKQLVRIEEETIDYVAFVNGITRTIWLLSHGARCFPIECSTKEGAERLSEIAGYDGNSYKTVEQLTAST